MNNSRTNKFNNIYYISIIAFITLMNREICKITITIFLIYYVMNSNIGSVIIITLINTTLAIVTLMEIFTYIIHLTYFNNYSYSTIK